MSGGPTVSLYVVDHFGEYSKGRNKEFIRLAEKTDSVIFGRDANCDLVLRPADPDNEYADKAVSRIAGEFVVATDFPNQVEVWNHSSTNWIIVTGDRGHALNMTPRSRAVLTQQDTVLWIEGQEANYGLNVHIPDADVEVFKRRYAEIASRLRIDKDLVRQQTILAASAESLRGSFAPAHQVILESMFRDYLSPRPGVFPRPRTVREVREETANSPECRATYDAPLTDDHVLRVVKNAVEAAKSHKVPGMEQPLGSHSRRPADQAEWTRHRLAMFLLGTGVITRSD